MKIPHTFEFTLDQNALIAALRKAGYKIPDDATFLIDSVESYDSRNAASVGPDGPLRISWPIEVDVGGIEP